MDELIKRIKLCKEKEGEIIIRFKLNSHLTFHLANIINPSVFGLPVKRKKTKCPECCSYMYTVKSS